MFLNYIECVALRCIVFSAFEAIWSLFRVAVLMPASLPICSLRNQNENLHKGKDLLLWNILLGA